MPFDPQIHHRHSLRIPGYDYTREGAYFVTLVTNGRECLFGAVIDTETRLSDYGRLAAECWTMIPDHFPHVELGVFVIMPNHIHGILILNEPDAADAVAATSSAGDGSATLSPPVGAQHVAPLPNIASLHGAHRPHVVSGSLGSIIRSYKSSVTRIVRQKYDDPPQRIWQRNYYEHVIRNAMDHEHITDYILDNPLHWDRDEENIPLGRPNGSAV